MQKQFAFWKYDLFPFLLGGEVTKMREDGKVETKEYGRNTYFVPVKILPLKDGKAINERLRELEREYKRSLEAVRSDFMAQRNKIIKVEGRKS